MLTDTPLSVADVLSKAADLIEPEGAWIQGDFAKNAAGENTGLTEFRGPAVCWCTYGAIEQVTDDEEVMVAAEVFLAKMLKGTSIAEWNDARNRTQAEVVAKLREAATLARAGDA
jgi:isopropylmalate/homocitrate/citramalate synthase